MNGVPWVMPFELVIDATIGASAPVNHRTAEPFPCRAGVVQEAELELGAVVKWRGINMQGWGARWAWRGGHCLAVVWCRFWPLRECGILEV